MMDRHELGSLGEEGARDFTSYGALMHVVDQVGWITAVYQI